MYRLCTFTTPHQTSVQGTLLALFAITMLSISGGAGRAMDLATVSIEGPSAVLPHNTATVTLTLKTTAKFASAKTFNIELITTFGGTIRTPRTVTLPANTLSVNFTFQKSDFVSAQEADGSLKVFAKLVRSLEQSGSDTYELSIFEPTITFSAPLPTVVAQPILVSIEGPSAAVPHDTATVTLTLKAVRASNSAKTFNIELVTSGGTITRPRQVILPANALTKNFTFQKSDFVAAQKSDGSLQVFAKLVSLLEQSSLYELSPQETTINFSAPPPTVVLQPGKLTLTKTIKTGPDAPSGTFKFTISGDIDGGVASTEYRPAKTGSNGFTPVKLSPFQIRPNGTVTVTDDAPKEFKFSSASCTIAGTTHGTTPVTANSFRVTVPAGATVDCTVTNTIVTAPPTAPSAPAPIAPPAPLPPIARAPAPTLTLQTVSTGSTGTFQFAVQYGAGSRQASITTTRANEAKGLAAFAVTSGQLVITQAATPNFTFFDANCSLGANNHARVVNIDARTVSTQMPATGNVVCTIINRGAEAYTKTVVSQFVKRRVQQLTSHIGQTRRSAGRFAGGRRTSSGAGLSGAGTDAAGHLGMQANLSRLGAAVQPDSPTAKAAKLGVDASEYGVDDGPQYRSGWDIWTEGSWSYHKTDGRKSGGLASSGQFGVLRAGADYLVNSKLLLGVSAQYDYLSDSSKTKSRDGYRIHGHGWLAGPYVEVGLTENLFFDAKALWGTSKNEISPDLTYKDEFTTQRWLASARLTGSWSWKHTERSAWTFSPRAEVVWFNESVTGYTNSQGVTVGGEDVHLGRFNIGPEFSYRYTTASGIMIEPRVGAQALLSFSYSGTGAGDGLDSATRTSVKDAPIDNFQMRFTGGLKIELPQGTRVELEGSYTGLGEQGYESVSGKLGLTIPLQ